MQLSIFSEKTKNIEDSLDYALQLFNENLKGGKVRVSSIYDFERLAKLKIELSKIQSNSEESSNKDMTITVSYV